MKKTLCVILVWAFILSCCTFVSADDYTVSDIVLAKRALAEKHKDEYIENYSITKEAAERKEQVVEYICKMQAGLLDVVAATSSLEALGVYKLETPIQEDAIYARTTQPSDISMSNPMTYYDSYNNQWFICGGGAWDDDNAWIDDVPANILPYVGQQLNVGGYDGVGIKIYNTSGTYNTRVVESYAYYSDGNNDYYNYSPSIYDGRKGAFFQYQDKAVVAATVGLVSSYNYIGKHFSAMVIYDSNFKNFNGYARTCYTHTWSSAQIDSVSFGTDGNAYTFQLSISNARYSFSCYSSGETVF